jgi:hypothetical protein
MNEQKQELTDLQRAMKEHDDDMARLDRNTTKHTETQGPERIWVNELPKSGRVMAYVSPIREVGSGRSLSLAEYIRADLPTTGAHCPFCDSGLALTNEEAAAERGFSGPMGTNREGYTEEEERDWTWFTTEHDRTFDQGLYSTNDAKYYVKRAVVRALKLRDRAYPIESAPKDDTDPERPASDRVVAEIKRRLPEYQTAKGDLAALMCADIYFLLNERAALLLRHTTNECS